jgi:hypothetical protein
LFRQAFDDWIALLGCYLAGVSPFLALYSVHVRSESIYLFLSTLAIALFATALTRRSLARFFLGGIVAGCAYLVRPEAIGFLVIVPAVLLFQWWRRDNRFSSLIQSVGATTLGFLLFALPFIVYLSIDTGRFGAISRKAGVTLAVNLRQSGMLDEDDAGTQSTRGDSFSFTDYILQHPLLYLGKVASDIPAAFGVFFEALHYSYLPFLLFGAYLAIRLNDWRGPQLLVAASVLFFVVGFALIYVKRRYSLQAVPISLGWVALAIGAIWDKLHAIFTARQARWVAACVGAIFLTATLPKTLRPVSREKAYVRDTGWYLKARNKSGNLRVAVFDERVTFYAEAQTVLLLQINALDLARYLKEHQVDYLAAESKAFEKAFPKVVREPQSHGLVLEKSFVGSRNDRMMLFKVS